MSNPVVVFFDLGRVPKHAIGFLDHSAQVFLAGLPVGVGVDGAFVDPQEDDCELRMLILDDARSVSEQLSNSRHTNKDPSAALLVVVHNGSTHNKEPQEERILESWGRPIQIRSFSHLDTDSVFLEILRVLGEPSAAIEFVEKCEGQNLLRACEVLAAICVLNMLSPEVAKDFKRDIDIALSEFPISFGGDWDECQFDDGSWDWTRRLELVKQVAEPLAL